MGDPQADDGSEQGRQQAGQQDFFLPCQQPGAGHAQHHFTDSFRLACALGPFQQIAIRHRLAIDAGVEFQHIAVILPLATPLVEQHLALTVVEDHVLQVCLLHGQACLAAQIIIVPRQHPILR